jgi:hypothetical protein
MKFLDLLAKLGIFRFGAKVETYTSAHNRPNEFLMDDVLNAKRDLIASKDVKDMLGGNKDDKPPAAR